jgi:hypothetical protein
MTRPVYDGNTPWVVRAISVFGVPAAMALFLMWYVTLGPGGDKSSLREHFSETVTIQNRLDQHLTHTEMLHRNIEHYMQVQTLLTRQLCVNASETEDDRAACFKP